MTTVIIAVVVLAVLGAIFGLVLAIASKVFAVEVDPREEAILGCLPGANCGGCGYPGCSGYASAVVKGVAPVNACAAGGEAVAAQIGEIMGVSAGAAVKQIAQVHCTGCGQNYKQYTYVGIHDCVAASKLPGGGDLGCAYGCLGLGSCEKACPFDAIHVIDGVARVDEEKCKACNKCVDICPRHIIALEPYKTKRHVTIPCSSHDKGVDARKVCDNGCIGCSLCAKPQGSHHHGQQPGGDRLREVHRLRYLRTEVPPQADHRGRQGARGEACGPQGRPGCRCQARGSSYGEAYSGGRCRP